MNKREIIKFAHQFYVEMQIEETLPLEQYQIFIKEGFKSASWRFTQERHQIVIGTDIFKNANPYIKHDEKVNYLRAYLYHELAHSIFTDKDIKKINDILIGEGMAFNMFNLFEDARIEKKMRELIKTPFEWQSYEDIALPQNPLELFFFILQTEERASELQSVKESLYSSRLNEFETVYKFYKKVLSCENSTDVISVLKLWYEIFPDTPKYVTNIKKKAYLFQQESKTLLDDKIFDSLIDGEDDLTLTINCEQNTQHSKRSVDGKAKAGTLLSASPVAIAFDENMRDILLHKMQKLFYTHKRTEPSAIASKKLNVKRLATGTDKRYKRVSTPTLCKKKISVIFDLSGSMYKCMENMRLLLDVLDKMAAQNIIEGTLILTALTHEARYEIIPMPLPDNTIERLVPKYGGEGLSNTMRKNINLLSQSDFVWIFTDGQIDDRVLDKEFFHTKQIQTHAMYIGDVKYKSKMKLSFDYVICEKSVYDLAQKIFYLVK